MNFGIIGAGTIGRFHAHAIRDMRNGTLRGIACRGSEKAAQLASEFGVTGHASIGELLADPSIDVVTVATPSGTHLDVVELAAAAGKHVLVEKPLEVSTARIDAMAAACGRAGVTLGAILNRRFNPAVEAVERALAAGRFGTLTLCSASVKWWRTQAYYDSATWRGTKRLDGGGALMNQSIHTVDQLLHFAGDARRVTAFTGRVGHAGIEVEDVAVACIEFASGARGVIEATTAAWSAHGHPAEIHLCGTRGTVFLADDRLRHWEFDAESPPDAAVRSTLMSDASPGLGAADPGAIDPRMHRLNFEHFVDALQGRTELKVGVAEARRAVRLVEAIYESAEAGGRPVEV